MIQFSESYIKKAIQDGCKETSGYYQTICIIWKQPDFLIETLDDIARIPIKTTPRDTLKLSSAMTFQKKEKEISARWIMRYLAQRGNTWKPFKLSSLQKFYEKTHKEDFWFNGLEDGNERNGVLPLIKIEGNTCYVSNHFVLLANLNSDFKVSD